MLEANSRLRSGGPTRGAAGAGWMIRWIVGNGVVDVLGHKAPVSSRGVEVGAHGTGQSGGLLPPYLGGHSAERYKNRLD